ncbi:MAG: carbonic anhydrase [Pseudohongiellaceae bacterium]
MGLCQSPVNISSTLLPEGHHEVHLDDLPSTQRIINRGHTVELDYDSGSTLTFDGELYELRQFHFHTPSEHLIDGVTYPMELHLVHTLQGDAQQYLVEAIL